MRIVLAVHGTNRWLGVNKYFYLLGKHLARLGVDVEIIVDSPEGVRAVREVCGHSVYIACLGPVATGIVATVRYCRNLARHLARQSNFDILHCGHVLPFFYLQELRRRPVVFQPFGNELFTLAGRGLNKWYCLMAQPVLRYCAEHSDILLSEGQFQHPEMRMYYPRMQQLRVLPVGVEVDEAAVQRDYTVNGDFQFLAVNSLLPYEGIDALISAFRKMYNLAHASLMIVGSGSEEDQLRRLAIGLPIRFRKDVPEADLLALYRGADAFVCTTHETDFQMGVLEAMVAGLPVLCRDETWVPRGVMTFRRDGLDLADKMAAMAVDSACNRRQVGEKGLEEVRQYSFAEIAAKALAIYSEVVAR